MPNSVVLEQKKQIVAELTDKFRNSVAGVLVDYKGITVEDDTKLRNELRAAGVEYSVVKNTMTRRVCENLGYQALNGSLEGMTSIALSEKDPVAAAKILCKYAEKIPTFTIKAGFVDGTVIDAVGVEALSKLPSKEVLVAKVLGSLNAPISGLVNVLSANLRGLAVALQAIADQKAAQ
ncbi:MAG: 50S ribosomal protein L10 [Eubacteriales bacterium]